MFSWIRKFGRAKELLNGQDLDDLLPMIDDTQLQQLQRMLLQMYQDILQVCEKHGVTPFLVGGSALGAVRHHGFIPWDDDLDVGIFREECGTFVRAFREELSDRYILNAPRYAEHPKARFIKIYRKGTVCRDIFGKCDKEDSLNGVFVDVFVIENIPRSPVIRAVKGTYCNFLQFVSGQVFLAEHDNPLLRAVYLRAGKTDYYVRKMIGTLFSFRHSDWWFRAVDKAARHRKTTGLYGIVTGRKHYFGEIFEEQVLLPACYLDFCGIRAPVFHDVDTYLRNLYGDYRKLPPVEKRERHYLAELSFEAPDGSARQSGMASAKP